MATTHDARQRARTDKRLVYDPEEALWWFSTGLCISNWCGIWGITARGGITEGYDSEADLDDLTPQERAELADLMIARWQRWKAEGPWEA